MPQRIGSLHDGFLRLLFGAHEQHHATLAGKVGHEGVGLVHADEGLLEVEDVDVAAAAEDVGFHLGVPATGLVTEVRACFKQRLNADFRHFFLHSLVLCPRSSPNVRSLFRWPLAESSRASMCDNCRHARICTDTACLKYHSAGIFQEETCEMHALAMRADCRFYLYWLSCLRKKSKRGGSGWMRCAPSSISMAEHSSSMPSKS